MSFTSDDELMAELMALFSSEAAERLQSLNRNLLALEETTEAHERDRLLAEIFREAHTLKGGAAAVDLGDVKTLAHHLESIFGGMQRGALEPGPEIFDLLYRTLDGIESLVQEARSGEQAQVDVTGLAGKLESVAEGDMDPGGAEPASVEKGSLHVARAASEDGPQLPAPPEGAKPVADDPAVAAPSEETIRVPTLKLDSLMTRVGELVVAGTGSERNLGEIREIAEALSGVAELWSRARFEYRRSPAPSGSGGEQGATTSSWFHLHSADAVAAFLEEAEPRLTAALSRLHRLDRSVRADGRRMHQMTADLQDDVRRARMLPASTIFDAFPRMVRDLAREQGKKVRLVIRGGDTEMDRAVLEQVKAPLTHLLRNCVDHGLEQPDARTAAGKPGEGTITLTASQQGDTVLIEVVDDGAGVDIERVKATAIDGGLVAADEAEALSDRDALSLIFRSGLSTSPLITDVSGRGVGLDVVRENVERLNGTLELDTSPRQGTRFSLVMPLTVTTTRCVLVRVGEQSFGLPMGNVVCTLRVEPEDVHQVEGRQAVSLTDGPLPLRNLAAVLGIEDTEQDGRRRAVVVRSSERRVAVLIDEITGVEEVVIKPLPRPLLKVRHTAGATRLGTGEVVVVLNVAEVVRSALRPEAARTRRDRHAEAAQEGGPGVILLADDSITTRTLEKNILQAAGYDVRVAVDGLDAWTALQADGADLVLSDIQMPRMDGFELTGRIRSDERFKHLPVVLVTSLESGADRKRGIEVGADAYIGKSSFDQEQVLDVIRRLI